MLKYKIPTLPYMIIIGCFTTLLFSSTLFSGLTSITSNSEDLGKISDTSGNTMIIPQAAAQKSETEEEEELQKEKKAQDNEAEVPEESSKDLAKTQEEMQEQLVDEPCTVSVTLVDIEYSKEGKDIGNNWRFEFGGQPRDFTLIHGQRSPFIGASIFEDKIVPVIRDDVITDFINFEYKAREIDPDFDDIGGGFLKERLLCPPQTIFQRQEIDAGLFVTERGKGMAGADVANIVFHFVVFLSRN